MDYIILSIGSLIIFLVLYRFNKKLATSKRETFIDRYSFPSTISNKLLDIYPHLSTMQANEVIHGLRQYFHICNKSGNKMIAMPSQAVDVAWHEFILITREYKGFCNKAFGRFLHHTPAEAMKSKTYAQDGIKRAWKLSCQRENISPRSPHALPILFAIDSDLNIPNGFKYSLDCKKTGYYDYCASHIGCGSCTSGCGSGCGADSSGDSGCGGD